MSKETVKKEAVKKDPILDEDVIKVLPVEEPKPVAKQEYGNQVILGNKAKVMKAKLASESKTTVFVPLAPGEKLGVTQSVVLNGYPMFVPKGKYIEVPQSVRDILELKLKQKVQADSHPSKIDVGGEVKLSQYGA